MTIIRKNARVLLIALGMALAAPVVLHFAAGVAYSSGYMVASGIDGAPVCIEAPGGDCGGSV